MHIVWKREWMGGQVKSRLRGRALALFSLSAFRYSVGDHNNAARYCSAQGVYPWKFRGITHYRVIKFIVLYKMRFSQLLPGNLSFFFYSLLFFFICGCFAINRCWFSPPPPRENARRLKTRWIIRGVLHRGERKNFKQALRRPDDTAVLDIFFLFTLGRTLSS